MSRKIIIKSTKQILEQDIANEVIDEMSKQNHRFDLKYDNRQKIFVSEQYDDSHDGAIMIEAEKLYNSKVQKRREEQIENKLKEKGYLVEKIKKDGKIKIIAKQRVYVS